MKFDNGELQISFDPTPNTGFKKIYFGFVEWLFLLYISSL